MALITNRFRSWSRMKVSIRSPLWDRFQRHTQDGLFSFSASKKELLITHFDIRRKKAILFGKTVVVNLFKSLEMILNTLIILRFLWLSRSISNIYWFFYWHTSMFLAICCILRIRFPFEYWQATSSALVFPNDRLVYIGAFNNS